MKLGEILEAISKGELAENEFPDSYYLAVFDLVAWAKHANETLISVDALFGEILTPNIEREISLLIDMEVQ